MSILKKSKFLFRPWRELPLWDATADEIRKWFEMFGGGKYKDYYEKFENYEGTTAFEDPKEDFMIKYKSKGGELYRDLHLVIKKEKTKTILFLVTYSFTFSKTRVLDVI